VIPEGVNRPNATTLLKQNNRQSISLYEQLKQGNVPIVSTPSKGASSQIDHGNGLEHKLASILTKYLSPEKQSL
jgi:hypothetical protein